MSAPLRRSLPLAARALAGVRRRVSQDQTLSEARITDPALRAAARSLAYSAVRQAMLCETLVDQLARRPPPPDVRDLLMVSLAQLIDCPERDFALVNEAVSVAHGAGAATAGFVNACLRSFLRRREELLGQAEADPCLRYNAPRWWLDRLARDLGPERARRALAAQMGRPPLILRVNQRRLEPAEWLRRAAQAGQAARPIAAAAVELLEPRPAGAIHGFTEGLVSVQDSAAQLAAPWLGPRPGLRVLDACAAPGGKTGHLLELADCQVTALDRSPERAALIEDNLRRLGLSATVLTGDAGDTSSWWDGQLFDRVLLDAPCSGSGVVSRHPEIPLIRDPDTPREMAARQRLLLDALWPCLRVGGKLLYVVCSLFAAEGREQVDSFLRRHPDARPLPLIDGQDDSSLTLIPTRETVDERGLGGPHDGFCYALLSKI